MLALFASHARPTPQSIHACGEVGVELLQHMQVPHVSPPGGTAFPG